MAKTDTELQEPASRYAASDPAAAELQQDVPTAVSADPEEPAQEVLQGEREEIEAVVVPDESVTVRLAEGVLGDDVSGEVSLSVSGVDVSFPKINATVEVPAADAFVLTAHPWVEATD